MKRKKKPVKQREEKNQAAVALIDRRWAAPGAREQASERKREYWRKEKARQTLCEEAAELLSALANEDGCRLDHNGDCQAHGWFDPEKSECPHARAQRWLERWRTKSDD